MGFQLSPGVSITETDLTTIVPAVASTAAAFCGPFQWGPCDEVTLVSKENELRTMFGLPDSTDTAIARHWFTASSFLSYGTNLQVVRVVPDTGAVNATDNDSTDSPLIKNRKHYNDTVSALTLGDSQWAAKYPGVLGNSLKVVVIDSSDDTPTDGEAYENYLDSFDSMPGSSEAAKALAGVTTDTVDDELHILVIDEEGAWTGTAGTVLERFAFVSKAANVTNPDGTTNYYVNVVNNESEYIWWIDHNAAGNDWGNDCSPSQDVFDRITAGYAEYSLAGGASGTTSSSDIIAGFEEHFADESTIDVSLLIAGPMIATDAAQLVDIADERRDCIAFISASPANLANSATHDHADAIAFRSDLNRSSSYAVLDSGWKYMYDRYNDQYHYVPLCGDIAGCTVQTDDQQDPWWSPAGFSRGRIRNVVKLPYNPTKAQRDVLYSSQINPVVTFEGEGTVLFGDKTLLTRPSAFDRINVRRLFIVIEKAIATAAKYQLFEFNDFFTRQQFKSMVEPYLRDVQARRGIQEFKVICDDTNNTPAVIDSNRFVADIFIKPNRVINFIQLNFIATPTGLNFDEIGG